MQLYNEASPDLQWELWSNYIDFQFAPPGIHFCNAAERKIITFKEHFTAGLCSTGPELPKQNWDRLLEQAEILLKLLRHSRLNPKQLAYVHMNGTFDYNHNPM